MRVKETYQMLHFLHYQLRCLGPLAKTVSNKNDCNKSNKQRQQNEQNPLIDLINTNTAVQEKQFIRPHSNSLNVKSGRENVIVAQLQYLKRQPIPLYALNLFNEDDFNKTAVTPLQMDWTNISYLTLTQRRLMIAVYCKHGYGYLVYLRQIRESVRPLSFGIYKSQLGVAFLDTIRCIESYLRSYQHVKPLNRLQARVLLGTLYTIRDHFESKLCEMFMKCMKTAYLIQTEMCKREEVMELYGALVEKCKENVNKYHMKHNNRVQRKQFEWSEELNLLYIQKYMQFKSMKSLSGFFRRRFAREVCKEHFTRWSLLQQLRKIFRPHILSINKILVESGKELVEVLGERQMKQLSSEMVYINARIELCRIILGIQTNVSKFFKEVVAVRNLKQPRNVKKQRDEICRGVQERGMQQLLIEQISDDE